MSNGAYSLPCGRKVYLRRLYLDRTYSGFVEGTPIAMTRFVLRTLREDVHRLLSPAEPLVIHEPGTVPLPQFRLIAELKSDKGVKTDDSTVNSFLYVCWFADSIGEGIDHLLSPILATIDWEGHAKDYDSTDF